MLAPHVSDEPSCSYNITSTYVQSLWGLPKFFGTIRNQGMYGSMCTMSHVSMLSNASEVCHAALWLGVLCVCGNTHITSRL